MANASKKLQKLVQDALKGKDSAQVAQEAGVPVLDITSLASGAMINGLTTGTAASIAKALGISARALLTAHSNLELETMGIDEDVPSTPPTPVAVEPTKSGCAIDPMGPTSSRAVMQQF